MLHINLVSKMTDEQLGELLRYTPGFSQKNLEKIKQLSLEKIKVKEIPDKRKMSMRKLAIIAVAAVFFLVTSTAVFAATGGLEQFLAHFNPNFGEFAVAHSIILPMR